MHWLPWEHRWEGGGGYCWVEGLGLSGVFRGSGFLYAFSSLARPPVFAEVSVMVILRHGY